MVPGEKDFAYAIRLVSDILESNGSSSMATVCAGSLALMDGGVPVKKAVAGIAMGLIKEGDSFAVLSDILGNEDHFGYMDFKVAGTDEGITGFQMDIKVKGVSFEVMEIALRQAKDGRLHILGIMNATIDKPRATVCSFAPTLTSLQIPTELIGSIIGPGGKIIQGMQKEFGVEISIEDDGTIQIAGPDAHSAHSCAARIRLMVTQPTVGEVYDGVVTKLMEFGALVEILPGKSGLVHISEIDLKKVQKVTDYFKEGDKVRVKLLRIENGKYSLSRKALLKEAAGVETKKRD
jgi:polyribonucleotide nucleotidyltransferase